MSAEEREEMIVAINLRTTYALSYLESLQDEELRELYEYHLSQ